MTQIYLRITISYGRFGRISRISSQGLNLRQGNLLDIVTEFSYWRVPADANNATAKYYDALMQKIAGRSVIDVNLPNAWWRQSWGGGLLLSMIPHSKMV